MLPDLMGLVTMVTSVYIIMLHVSDTFAQLEVLPAGICVERGFSSNLLCSSCDKLTEFGLTTLVEDCQSCCLKDADTEQKTYAKAVLEVCS